VFFRAIFHRSPKFALKEGAPGSEETGKKPGVKTSKKTSKKTGEKILHLIRANPEITAAELAEVIGLTASGVRWNIGRQKETGHLRCVGPDKGGHWEVVE